MFTSTCRTASTPSPTRTRSGTPATSTPTMTVPRTSVRGTVMVGVDVAGVPERVRVGDGVDAVRHVLVNMRGGVGVRRCRQAVLASGWRLPPAVRGWYEVPGRRATAFGVERGEVGGECGCNASFFGGPEVLGGAPGGGRAQ